MSCKNAWSNMDDCGSHHVRTPVALDTQSIAVHGEADGTAKVNGYAVFNILAKAILPESRQLQHQYIRR